MSKNLPYLTTSEKRFKGTKMAVMKELLQALGVDVDTILGRYGFVLIENSPDLFWWLTSASVGVVMLMALCTMLPAKKKEDLEQKEGELMNV